MDRPSISNDSPSSDSDEVYFDSQSVNAVDDRGNEASGLLIPETYGSFRDRSNSDVDYDIIVTNPRSSQSQLNLPEFIRDYEHDRGDYRLPVVSSDVLPEDEYTKNSQEPGEIFIYNFETFPGSPARDGTRLDVRSLIDTFGRLKFNVPKERIFNDLTRNNVLATIETAITRFNSESPQKPNCLIVVFLTHGLANNVIEVKDNKMTVGEIIHKFSNCKALNGVPKWFTFLACKKDENDYRSDPQHSIVSDETYIKRLPDDVILYYSSTENNKSARRGNEGSWVIQELCKSLSSYGRRDDVFEILTRTNKCVANNYHAYDREDEYYFRQCPVILSTLTKRFFLTLSKDRVAHLTILNKVGNMVEKINETQGNSI